MKKKYIIPQTEVTQALVSSSLLENSGTYNPGEIMSKENGFSWDDGDINNLWGDDPEEDVHPAVLNGANVKTT